MKLPDKQPTFYVDRTKPKEWAAIGVMFFTGLAANYLGGIWPHDNLGETIQGGLILEAGVFMSAVALLRFAEQGQHDLWLSAGDASRGIDYGFLGAQFIHAANLNEKTLRTEARRTYVIPPDSFC